MHAHPGQREGDPGGRLPHQQGSTFTSSVVAPNTLKWDPIVNFGPIWNRIQGYGINFEKKRLKYCIIEKNNKKYKI